MKRTDNPHPWSVWIGRQRIATTRHIIDAATVAVLHGKGTRIRFAGWVVGKVPDDAISIEAFAHMVRHAAIIKQSNALRKLKRTPATPRAERRSA